MVRRSAIGLCWILIAVGAFACQESKVVYATKKHIVRLTDAEGNSLIGKDVLIRKAYEKEFQSKSGTFRMNIRGEFVGTLRTDDKGRINFKGLQPGMYWFTYLDDKDGESFLVQIESGHERGEFQLSINQFQGMCYLEDVERNVRKPAGWGTPFCNDGPCEDRK